MTDTPDANEIPTPRVCVHVPAYRPLTREAFAYITMACVRGARFVAVCPDGRPDITTSADCFIANARNLAVDYALEALRAGRATHLLFLDDDTVPPSRTLELLLARKVPVVSGVVYRRDDARPAGWESLKPPKRLEHLPLKGLHRVGCVGFGCTLLDLALLAQMRKRYGAVLFETQHTAVDASGKQWLAGEDYGFGLKLAEMGIPVYIDCDVACGHVGTQVIAQEDYVARYSRGA